MKRDPVRLVMGGPAGARLARAMRAARRADPPYDVEAGYERFAATLGAAAAVGTAVGAATDPHAASAVATKSGAVQTLLGATKTLAGLKTSVSSILLIGAIGSGAIVATSKVMRSSEPAPVSAANLPRGDALGSSSPLGARVAGPGAVAASGWASSHPRDPSIEREREAAARGGAARAQSAGAARDDAGRHGAAPHGDVPYGAEPGDARRGASISANARASSAHSSGVSRPGALAPRASGASPARDGAGRAVDLKPEMEHLASIRRTYDPVRALALAEEGHARFPRGLFWQERESIAIGALARLGRGEEAKARARSFVARHPESLYVEELRRLIDGD